MDLGYLWPVLSDAHLIFSKGWAFSDEQAYQARQRSTLELLLSLSVESRCA
jgi:hypothetical protein